MPKTEGIQRRKLLLLLQPMAAQGRDRGAAQWKRGPSKRGKERAQKTTFMIALHGTGNKLRLSITCVGKGGMESCIIQQAQLLGSGAPGLPLVACNPWRNCLPQEL